jgi:hypothetical protein
VRPEVVAEVSFVEWTPDSLLRHVVYLGEREDKAAAEVHRNPPQTGETLGFPFERGLKNLLQGTFRMGR